MKDPCFIPLTSIKLLSLIPDQLNDPFDSVVPKVCKLATLDFQALMLKNQQKWQLEFGLEKGETETIKGKMFGVLVVENAAKEIGYLCTFSGKFASNSHPSIFVPSLFDISTNDYFITKGMLELSVIGDEIKNLKIQDNPESLKEIEELKVERKTKSILLQQALFDHYHFLNKGGKSKSLRAIFEDYGKKKPAAGAGECAAPKLLQYAYSHGMKPLAIAEFWWGKQSKSGDRKHKNFYPACNDKCRPILGYMLGG